MSEAFETPEFKLRPGDIVTVRGHEEEGERVIIELLNQEKIPGGVRLDRPVGHYEFRSWNEDALNFVRRTIEPPPGSTL